MCVHTHVCECTQSLKQLELQIKREISTRKLAEANEGSGKGGLFTVLNSLGVPIVAQCLTNLTRNHEVVGLIPGLSQWVKDPVLP